METLRLVIAGCFGLVVGSFLNVVIWRLPRGESIVTPGSHCPGCDQPIRWFDNLPVLSWLLLRGRCRRCKTAIALRYPLVEALTGVLFVLAAARWPGELATIIVVCAGLAALVAISFIDWDHKIIPDRITKPGIVVAVGVAPLTVLHPPDWVDGLGPVPSAWLHAAAGAAAGALVIFVIRVLGSLAFRKEAMGLGDVKLLAFIGAFTGPIQVLYALVLACVGGAVVGILRLLWSKGRPQRFEIVIAVAKEETAFDAAVLDGDAIEVVALRAATVGKRVRVRMTLPAAGILEDEDATIDVPGKVLETTERKGGHRWRIRLLDLGEEDGERLGMLQMSWRYVPFGPFLAMGGAAVLLYGDDVHWLITEGYPEFARGLFGG
jgi:leader peptidase (prepilin peptidase)/N-methyltransferase